MLLSSEDYNCVSSCLLLFHGHSEFQLFSACVVQLEKLMLWELTLSKVIERVNGWMELKFRSLFLLGQTVFTIPFPSFVTQGVTVWLATLQRFSMTKAARCSEKIIILKKFLLGWQTSYPPIVSIKVVSWCAFHPKGKTLFILLLYVLLSLGDQVEVCGHVQGCVSKDTEKVWHRTYFSNWKLISGFFSPKKLYGGYNILFYSLRFRLLYFSCGDCQKENLPTNVQTKQKPMWCKR